MQLLPSLTTTLLFLSTTQAVDIISETFKDERYDGAPQPIPGKVWAAYADVGPDLGYHINGDCINKCSCTFNPCDGVYENMFRKDECLTTCYTKNFHGPNFCCDTWASNGTQLPVNLLMIGYTFIGNWYSFTVNVADAGTYSADFFGSSHHGGDVSFDVDYIPQTGNISVSSTGWWHNYEIWPDLFELTFDSAGLHVITVHIESIAPPQGFKEWGNLIWWDFHKKGEKIEHPQYRKYLKA